jgi:hypothetical protein
LIIACESPRGIAAPVGLSQFLTTAKRSCGFARVPGGLASGRHSSRGLRSSA